MHRLTPRIEALEEAAPSGKPVYLWAYDGDADKAIAERFPNGVPDDVVVHVYMWRKLGAESPQAH